MEQHKPRSSSSPPKRYVTATRNSRRLLIRRLQEIDKLSRKELNAMKADAEQLKNESNGNH